MIAITLDIIFVIFFLRNLSDLANNKKNNKVNSITDRRPNKLTDCNIKSS